MPDYGTTTPVAGWYTDPANATLERWWGGVEWTHDTRPIPVVEAARVQEFASVPGGGINPFAGEAGVSNSRLAAYDPSSETPTLGRGFGGASTQSLVSQSWYSQASGGTSEPEPTNGMATVGLVLSLLGISTIGLILSIISLMRARAFARRGLAPVGRTRGRWGIAVTFIWLLIAGAIGAYSASQPGSITQMLTAMLSPAADGPAVFGRSYYDRAVFERDFGNGFESSSGFPLDSITCPDTIQTTSGSSFGCLVAWSGQSHSVSFTFTDDAGNFDQYIDGVLVEQ